MRDDRTWALIRQAHQGDKAARDTLFEENIGLIWSVVKRFRNRGVEMDDLFQIGSIGLLKAVDHFNLDYKVKFSTYAVPLIAGEIKRFLRDDGMIRVSRSLKEISYKAYTVRERLEKELGREPTVEEIAAASGVLRGDNLVLLDKYAISQRLCKELPYITEVRVNRKFPDTLLVEVTETKAVASIQGAGGYWLINSGGESGGKLLEMVEAEAAKDYLQLIGLEAVEPAIGKRLELTEGSPVSRERLAALLGAMEDREMFARADNLDFTGPEELILNYDGRFRVEIFYDADFDFKLHCLLEVVARLEPNERGTIRMTLQDDNKAHFIPSAG